MRGLIMKDKVKNIICGGAVLALLGWTVYTIFQQQTPRSEERRVGKECRL